MLHRKLKAETHREDAGRTFLFRSCHLRYSVKSMIHFSATQTINTTVPQTILKLFFQIVHFLSFVTTRSSTISHFSRQRSKSAQSVSHGTHFRSCAFIYPYPPRGTLASIGRPACVPVLSVCLSVSVCGWPQMNFYFLSHFYLSLPYLSFLLVILYFFLSKSQSVIQFNRLVELSLFLPPSTFHLDHQSSIFHSSSHKGYWRTYRTSCCSSSDTITLGTLPFTSR